MAVHDIVIAVLLLFPWVLAGLAFVGPAASLAKRGLEHLQRAWRVRRREASVLALPQGPGREYPANGRTLGHSIVRQQSATFRKAA